MLLVMAGCKEEKNGPLSTAGAVPPPISNVQVKSLPGGARLTYNLPRAEDLLYVKAVYEAPIGTIREVKASLYVDSLILDGIGDTQEHEITLYAVTRSEVQSAPVKVKVRPLTPPVLLVRQSLSMVEDFGGVTLGFTNTNEASISIHVMVKDAVGSWIPVETFYTKLKSGFYSARGQASKPTVFGAYIQDRYSNKSDTLQLTLTPLFEKELARPTIISTLPSDINRFYQTYDYTRLFDKITDVVATGLTHTAVGSGMISSFTLDYRVPTTFSRFKLWQRGITNTTAENILLYAGGNPEIFEVYGSNTLVDDFSQWTKIATYTLVKPSGLPVGANSNDDIAAAKPGHDFQVPLGTPAFRYIRWRTTKTFGLYQYVWYAEITFYGNN